MQSPAAAGADTSLSNLSATGEQRVCQAWVNFNGTGTVAIRDSYNVSSITDNGTGDYTINFSTAMPNSNYSISTDGSWADSTGDLNQNTAISRVTSTPLTTTGARIASGVVGNGTMYDFPIITAQVFGD
jgi:hypothetical protein